MPAYISFMRQVSDPRCITHSWVVLFSTLNTEPGAFQQTASGVHANALVVQGSPSKAKPCLRLLLNYPQVLQLATLMCNTPWADTPLLQSQCERVCRHHSARPGCKT